MSDATLEEIKRLYRQATRRTIHRDLARAVSLLTSLQTEAERERAAVYLDGLAQMRAEWATTAKTRPRPPGPDRARGRAGRSRR